MVDHAPIKPVASAASKPPPTPATIGTTFARDRRADERALRDRKAERLRAAFKPVLHTAGMWQDIVHQQKFTWNDETREKRDARLAKEMEKASAGLLDAQLALDLEPEVGSRIRDLFDAARSAYVEHQIDVGLREDASKGLIPPTDMPSAQQLGKKEDALKTAVSELQKAMGSALATLEKPV